MEIWCTIKDFDNYQASNYGRIRNARTGRILKTTINQNGYECVTLRKNNMQYVRRVHRLVADAFYDGDHSDLDVNHIDGNKLNNNLSNLEFCTRAENIQHAFRTGLKKPSRQIKIRIVETGEVFDSIRECARHIGGNQAQIGRVLAGKENICKGYHFEKIM